MEGNEVQAGMTLEFGLDCYDLAGTIRSPPSSAPDNARTPGDQRIQFHTYWRYDLAPFGARQEWMLKSFFATQNIHTSRLILWSNGDLSGNPILSKYAKRFPDAFVLKIVDIPMLAVGTVLEGSHLLKSTDKKAWLDGDLIRLLLLWNYGGVWVDMDSLLTRDLTPLLEHEFVTQWDCYDKKYSPLNGALMRFRQHSAYLCEAFHIMRTDTPPRPGSTDWGSILYLKLYRRLIAASVPPFKILPFCFSDGRSCRLDNRLPDPFVADAAKGKWTFGLGMEEGGPLDKVLGNIFGVHLHNQWDKEFPKGGWVERLLLNRYEGKLLVRDGELINISLLLPRPLPRSHFEMVSSAFADRPYKKLVLFDVDVPLTLARQVAHPDIIKTLRELRKKVAIGFVGGSDLAKISGQLTGDGFNAIQDFDYAFGENGLTAYKMGKQLESQSFIKFVGEEKYKPLVNFILHYIADLDIPIKRGTFVEFRTGMINVSPIGRNATIAERIEFQAYDKVHGIRAAFIKVLKEKFPDYGLTYSIGGQISFDIFPHGWDKTYALRHVEDEGFEEIHFVGDNTQEACLFRWRGGNDYEIYSDPRTIGHTVTHFTETIQLLKELFP
ncbi:hypothetical protein V5O48_001430 [Marasmius crinis-equi]|uniref:Phosphomannomutase n=1 Tax=Marasmius crinis-equi TaxID=585013 RepID=A0ABR3FZP5_9AGAR